ncbi:MAG: dihydropteroate synthase [Bacteroidetes bacterium]|nr:MAG: dihydropteroate synthase [Bacteroidota bacterium]
MNYTFGSITYDLNSRTHIMGILNVTPDSFSDGGVYFETEKAVQHALRMVDEGADFIDIGGESTRPGAEKISVTDEISRVVPVIEQVAKHVQTPISIDTYKSEVAEQALRAGALIVNDVTGLHGDTQLPDVIVRHNASVIVMHIKGTPRTMQEHPQYENLLEEICSYLSESISIAEKKSIRQVIVDPGIGFGKTVEHNLEILRELTTFQRFGYPVLVGTSRKSFIGKILNEPVNERFEGTAASVAISIMNGANIVRVHDVKQMKRVAGVVDAIIKPKDKK